MEVRRRAAVFHVPVADDAKRDTFPQHLVFRKTMDFSRKLITCKHNFIPVPCPNILVSVLLTSLPLVGRDGVEKVVICARVQVLGKKKKDKKINNGRSMDDRGKELEREEQIDR